MTMKNKLLALALFASLPVFAQSEIILDNGTASFTTAGTWPASTAVSGFYGTNYQSHAPNGVPPGAIAVDNTDAGFSVTGTWASSTSVSGYLGSNYQHHYANGAPPTAVVADNLSGSFSGTWPTSTSVGGYYAANYQHHVAGTGVDSFTWTLNVPSAGTYEAYARWTQHPNRASNAKYTVNHAGGSDIVNVNQELGGGSWQLLGTYSFNAGATTVSLSDEADGYVIADAVMLVPPGASPNTATWSATIPTSGSYEVFARWTQHPNRASNAQYTVNHAGGPTQVIVNQMAGGGSWSSLGTFSFDVGAASVSVTDQADGYVIADAVMFLPPGSGPNAATWTPDVPQAGNYEVYARWTASSNRASNATYTVTHAGGSTPVQVDQKVNGGVWNLLGTFSLSPGIAHNVTLADLANGYVIADAIRLVPISVQAPQALYFVHTDHLNTPRLVADATGTTVWRWDQAEPFGANPAAEDPDANSVAFDLPLRLPGQRYDSETGLHYNYFRDYDPSIGRYEESDPIGLRAGLNTYAYVESSPVARTDAVGLFADLYLQGGVGGGLHVLVAGLNANCGPLVSIGATCQLCRWCTVCLRLGPGLYGGVGAVAGGGIAMGDVSSIAGDSIGVGGDIGFGGTVGGSGAVSVSGNVFTGPLGTPTGAGALKGRAGVGYGISIGLELCRTDLVCSIKVWGK
jgi:RHS repeat-associated protein